MTRHTNTDRELLTMLDLLEGDGLTAGAVGERMGRGKGSVIGAVNRIKKDYENIPCACAKPENKDGGMPRRWWAMAGGTDERSAQVIRSVTDTVRMPA